MATSMSLPAWWASSWSLDSLLAAWHLGWSVVGKYAVLGMSSGSRGNALWWRPKLSFFALHVLLVDLLSGVLMVAVRSLCSMSFDGV